MKAWNTNWADSCSGLAATARSAAGSRLKPFSSRDLRRRAGRVGRLGVRDRQDLDRPETESPVLLRQRRTIGGEADRSGGRDRQQLLDRQGVTVGLFVVPRRPALRQRPGWQLQRVPEDQNVLQGGKDRTSLEQHGKPEHLPGRGIGNDHEVAGSSQPGQARFELPSEAVVGKQEIV